MAPLLTMAPFPTLAQLNTMAPTPLHNPSRITMDGKVIQSVVAKVQCSYFQVGAEELV